MTVTATLDSRELGAVLAGLRMVQLVADEGWPEDHFATDIAADGGEHKPLEPAEIDALCMRLNVCEGSVDQLRNTSA